MFNYNNNSGEINFDPKYFSELAFLSEEVSNGSNTGSTPHTISPAGMTSIDGVALASTPPNPEPVSLDSLELPELPIADKEGLFKRGQNNQNNNRPIKKPRFRPCDGCRKRKIKCVLPHNSRICVECNKRNQACEFDNTKVLLFNNINSLSGMNKLIKDNDISDKLSPINSNLSSSNSGNVISSKSAVSNNGNGSRKSQRTRPCDNCKKRKSKCVKMDDNPKICVECKKRNLICTYSVHLINPSNSEMETIERPVSDYTLLNNPTIMTTSLSFLNSKSSLILGDCSIIEKHLLPTNTKSELNIMENPIKSIEPNNRIIRKLTDKVYFQVLSDDGNFINLKYLQCDAIEEIIGKNSAVLLSIYFRLVHPTLPILAKEPFYERYCRNYREIHPLLLVTIYLLALNWWELECNEFDNLVKPDVVMLEQIAISLMQDNLYETSKFSVLQALILLMNYNFKTVKNPFNSDIIWKTTSLISIFSQELGLNIPGHQLTNIPLWERKIRKIVIWAAVFHDKLYALFENKSSNFDLKNNWIIEKLSVNDFLIDSESLNILKKSELISNDIFAKMLKFQSTNNLETDLQNIDHESPKLKTILIFIETMNMVSFMDTILNEIYSLKSIYYDSFDTIYNKAVPIISSLQEWFDRLPDSVKLINSSSNNNNRTNIIKTNDSRFMFVSNGSLSLLYYTLLIITYKRLINKAIDIIEEENTKIDEDFKLKLNRMVASVQTILKVVIYDFLFDLKPYNMESFWLLSTKRSLIMVGVTIALIIKLNNFKILQAANKERNQQFIQYYKDYEWKLKAMAPDFNHARTSLQYLDSMIVLKEDIRPEEDVGSRFVLY